MISPRQLHKQHNKIVIFFAVTFLKTLVCVNYRGNLQFNFKLYSNIEPCMLDIDYLELLDYLSECGNSQKHKVEKTKHLSPPYP